MRLMFIICLAIVQANAMAATSSVLAKFDAVYSICTNVVSVGHGDFSSANGINLIGAPVTYFQAHGIDFNLNETLKITLIEGAKHGELRNDDFYFPNENYLGPDQMTFLVEVKGKVFKVVYSVYVNPNSEYVPPECGSGYNGYMIKEMPNINSKIGKGIK